MKLKNGCFEDMVEDIKQHSKKIVIFGAGVIGAVTVPEILSSYHLNPYLECYIDNDSVKWGNEVASERGAVRIYSPDHLQALGSNIVILLSISRYADVLEQLNHMDCVKEVSCYLIPMMCITNFHRQGGQGIISESKKKIIPKMIHYMWLGGKTMPENLQYCIDSWKKYCPDYEIVRWDETNYDVGKHPYMNQAYKNKMYGFVPDYARLDILYQYGGIYMDTDVEVIKPLNELLYQQAFCGVEKWQVINLGGCCGAVKGHKAVGALLNARQAIKFEEADGSLNKNTCGYYDTQVMLKHGYEINGTNQRILDMNIYTYDYFQPYDYISRQMDITSDTYTIHHFNGGWLDKKMRAENERSAQEFAVLYEKSGGRAIERRQEFGNEVSTHQCDYSHI